MENILITGARVPLALELARSFHLNGHKVIVADSLRFTIARWSNSVYKYYNLSSPRFKPENFINDVQQIIKIEKISHIIPTCEESFYLAEFKDQFDCKVWVPDISKMNSLHNKYSFINLARCYFKVPETSVLKDFKDWSKSENYAFKPVYSRFASSVIIGKEVQETDFSDEAKENWIAQKIVKGKEICIYSIWDNGKLKAFSSYHPLIRVGNGSGIFFESFKDKNIYQAIKTFGNKINYTGQLSFDAIIDENNEAYFIECNPRGTSGGHLINRRLSNSFLYENTLELQDEKEFSLKSAIAILKPLNFLDNRIRRSKDVTFQLHDMAPSILQFLSLLEITMIKFRKKITWLEATTQDIEWNNTSCI